MMRRLPLFFMVAAGAAAQAQAGDKPIYAPAPGWVLAAPPIDAAALDAASPALVIFDSQTRMEKGVSVTYLDTATRAISAQVLGQMGTVAIPWMPDRGDLAVHRAEIIRGSERIDLLARETRFTVLRREQMMEQQMLTGMLTATLSVEGLRVGDVLRVAFSLSQSDPALGGRVVGGAPTFADPVRAGFARTRFLWPVGEKVAWKAYAVGAAPVEKTANGMRELTLALPLAKQPEMPADLPQRMQRPLLIEASGFADWADVSRTLAPLYATDGLIAPGSPLDREVAAIAAAESDPLRRTQRALELVEDKVRYLAVAMNGGGLRPQTPAQTWELRYGDCKAKTLLLMAMLHRLGIEAEPVVVSAATGGLVEARLPGTAAFDHVIVRATVNGETLWLDGTRLGDRIEDIRDTPPFRVGLPLRAAGSGLIPLPLRPPARPQRIVDLTFDQSASIDLPALFDATFTLRGPYALMLDGIASQANAEQKRDLVRGLVGSEVGEAQISRTDIAYDPQTATATVTAAGLVTTPWRRENGRYRLLLDRAVEAIAFAPDRTRAAWRTLPVATDASDSVLYRVTTRLPAKTGGYALDGDQALPGTLGGRAVKRQVTLAGDKVTLEDRVDSFGAEIAAADLPAERARFVQARARQLRLVAPGKVPSRYEVVVAARRDGRFRPFEAAYAAAIAADPDEVTGYSSRASFRAGVYDREGAIADYTRVIELGADAGAYIARGELYEQRGEHEKAIADYEAARELDPASDAALLALAQARDVAGDASGAIALLDERIALGGKGRDAVIGTKAEVLALNGDAAGAVALLDARIAEKPGDPDLLNSRCWAKGIGRVALDSALKDCTKAIELADSPAAALDSRALAYVRLERWEDALADLDAALDIAPRMAASLFLRGVVRAKLGKPGAQEDLAAARMYHPPVDAAYRRLGITA